MQITRTTLHTPLVGTEGRAHVLVFPQGGDRIRLCLCYDFADKAPPMPAPGGRIT